MSEITLGSQLRSLLDEGFCRNTLSAISKACIAHCRSLSEHPRPQSLLPAFVLSRVCMQLSDVTLVDDSSGVLHRTVETALLPFIVQIVEVVDSGEPIEVSKVLNRLLSAYFSLGLPSGQALH